MGRSSGNRQKHENPNPVQRFLIDRFHSSVVDLAMRTSAGRILEVGCGEGFVLEALADAEIEAQLHGVDFSSEAIAEADRRLAGRAEVWVGDARDLLDRADSYDLVMMLEVLEHIEDPAQMLPVLEGLTKGPVLLSVPWEPWFRGLNMARGKNVAQFGNDPEHVNHWTQRQFLDFVSQSFDVTIVGSVFPWTLVLAER